jgi:Raf kinase inhibitor-like YbhB/YbcL family protein
MGNGRRVVAAFPLVLLSPVMLSSCSNGDSDMARATQTEIAQIDVTSPAFEDGGVIPQRYTCEGAGISPPLNWGPVPDGTQSITLIVDDPDAPSGTFVHWVLYDLPADVQGLPENLPGAKTFPVGGEQGVNSSDVLGYRGPCPPSGTHRYFFKVYALDIKTNLPPGETKERLLEVMAGHVLAQGQLMGRYRRRQ